MINIAVYFILFVAYSCIGWICEMVTMTIKNRKIINRGFLVGPVCPIYGVGAMLLLFTLNNYVDNPLVVFGLSILMFSVLEYSVSFIMEKLFHARWWDYSGYIFNINGRICLETMIPFGLLGLVVLYVINPFLTSLIYALPPVVINIIALILSVVMLTDFSLSLWVIIKYGIRVKKLHTDSTEEIAEQITKQMREEFIKSNNILKRRLVKAFPHAKISKK